VYPTVVTVIRVMKNCPASSALHQTISHGAEHQRAGQHEGDETEAPQRAGAGQARIVGSWTVASDASTSRRPTLTRPVYSPLSLAITGAMLR